MRPVLGRHCSKFCTMPTSNNHSCKSRCKNTSSQVQARSPCRLVRPVDRACARPPPAERHRTRYGLERGPRDGWDSTLKPVVVCYQGKAFRSYFRAGAALFAQESSLGGGAGRLPAHALLIHKSHGRSAEFAPRPDPFCCVTGKSQISPGCM